MAIEMIFAIGRILERLIIVLVGGGSLLMGYRLYAMGVVKKQVAEIAHDKTIIRFKDVGPGAFFVSFGALILIVALGKTVIFNSDSYNGNDNQKNIVISYGTVLSNRIPFADIIKASTTIINNVDPNKVSEGVGWKEKGIQQAIAVLAQQKRMLMASEFSQYSEYLKQREAMLLGKEPDYKKIEQKTYWEIDAIENSMFGETQ